MRKRTFIRLSYAFQENMPVYPGTPKPEIMRLKDTRKGDSCNTYRVSFSNHSGTHLDCPAHFFRRGKALCSYAVRELIFERPVICDCPKIAGEAITASDLHKTRGLNSADALLIRTGFSRHRDNPGFRTYCFKSPYLLPEAAEWLRNEFPGIRAIGIDCISFSSYLNRDAGRRTHRNLLRAKGFPGAPLLLIEDLDLKAIRGGIDELIALPLFFAGLDSAPCTVIGVKYD